MLLAHIRIRAAVNHLYFFKSFSQWSYSAPVLSLSVHLDLSLFYVYHIKIYHVDVSRTFSFYINKYNLIVLFSQTSIYYHVSPSRRNLRWNIIFRIQAAQYAKRIIISTEMSLTLLRPPLKKHKSGVSVRCKLCSAMHRIRSVVDHHFSSCSRRS